jgi:hypothetical protein
LSKQAFILLVSISLNEEINSFSSCSREGAGGTLAPKAEPLNQQGAERSLHTVLARLSDAVGQKDSDHPKGHDPFSE